jgi:hypothetical protein
MVVVVVVDAEVGGVAVLVETSWAVVEVVLGLGAACSAFAFFAGAPFDMGSAACCTFLFAISRWD